MAVGCLLVVRVFRWRCEEFSAQMRVDLVVNVHNDFIIDWWESVRLSQSHLVSFSNNLPLILTDINTRLSSRCVILSKQPALEVPLTRDILL